MKVKMLVNHVFLKNLQKENIEERYDLANPERYGTFRDVFGQRDFGFILEGDLEKEILKNEKAPVYIFRDDLYPIRASEGVDCDLFLPSSFSPQKGVLPSTKWVKKSIDYLEEQRIKGNIKNIINSKEGTLYEDKISILKLEEEGFKVPDTFHMSSFDEFKELVEKTGENYIIKHRYGHEGRGFYRIIPGNLESIKNLNLGEFIIQEELQVLGEKRLIFFDGEFLGARKISDRHMPWETEGKAGRKHITEKYYPTNKELEDTKNILKLFDATVGCIDWINTVEKGSLFLEYNGFGTGYGKGAHPYNFNKTVAERLKEKYL